MVKYRIVLTDAEREQLHSMLSKGKHASRKLTRARILLLSDESKTSGDFVAAMEDVLHLYEAPYDRQRPVICFD